MGVKGCVVFIYQSEAATVELISEQSWSEPADLLLQHLCHEKDTSGLPNQAALRAFM